jgi:hypothetical protein
MADGLLRPHSYVFVAALLVWLEVLALRLWGLATQPEVTR